MDKKNKSMEENVNNIIDTAMEKLKNIIDVNTVVGKPFSMGENTTVVPVSKVSVGFVAGGGEISGKNKKVTQFPFAGGSGSGFSVEPIGFLVFTNGEPKYISTQEFSPLSEIVKISNTLVGKVIKDKKELVDEKNN